MNQMTISLSKQTGTDKYTSTITESERKFKSNEHKHINRALSHENITIIKRVYKEVYHTFDVASYLYSKTTEKRIEN